MCEVRIALTPMRFMVCNCCRMPSSLTALPSAPSVWCRLTPSSFMPLPFNENPSAGSKPNQRIPNRVRTVSLFTLVTSV